ncbi:MAG: P-II family nitrogen regulator [Clostridia bacterium]|nr:P-II family nitrogen regulator [Clostridia bacterium]
MLKLVTLINISPRKNSEGIIRILNKNNIPMTLGRYGRGTATDMMLDYLGIAEKEKCITFSISSLDMAYDVCAKIKDKYRDIYSFAMPISTVGGKQIMEHLSENIPENTHKDLSPKFDKELLMIITNRGYVDSVMEIAREAGATGGTVIHARGTGAGDSEKFFGVTVGSEKEMIFIVTEKEKRNVIMQAIMKKAGPASKAGSVLFSLPVTEILI